MAMQIKDTPVLTGFDAERFQASMKSNATKKVSKTEMSRIKANFSKLKAISKF